MGRGVVRRIVAGVAAVLLLVGGSVTVDRGLPAAAAPTTPGWLHTDKATIRTAAGAVYEIKAAAWFGMETTNCAPHGLWSINLDSGLRQIAGMGFNTIRLPFSNECLAAASTNSINYSLNPTLQGKSVLQVMDIVVARAKAAGLNVILDRHRPDSAAQSELWYTAQYSEARWISDWKKLATRYKNEPAVIGFDLHNEPHGAACWGCGDAAVDWQAAATRAGNAVLAVNPKLLMIIEGVERQPDGSNTWWGGGLSGVAAKPVKLSVANRVVYSPHDYPASVFAQSWFTAPDYPRNLTALWDANWGYIAKKGTAPILLGEFGTKLETASDRQWLSTLVSYLDGNGMSFAYWSFNPNSGDTGGLVKDDWVTPQAEKLKLLAPLLGTAAAPKPTATAKPTPKLSTTAKPTPKPSTTPKPAATAKPTTSAKPTPKPTVVPTPSATTGAKKASAQWNLQSSWGAGYVADFQVSSTTGASKWSVTWPDTKATSIANSWGMTCTITVKTSITCTGSQWATGIAKGQTHSVGLQVTAPAAPQSPALTVNAS